jgi:predicted Zn-dependent protease
MRDAEMRVEGSLALLLIFSREGRHDDALTVVRALRAQYPRNRLFALEEGATAIRAGRAKEADQALTNGLEALDTDARRKFPGERALWLYKRGLARLNMNRPAEASADLMAALGQSPAEWVRGRIRLELGKVADLAGRRSEALAEYRTAKSIAEGTNDPLAAAEAARWMKRPFSMPARTP